MPQNPKSRENLRMWGPDNPPPKSPGRPKKRPLQESYDDVLRTPIPALVMAKLKHLGLKPGATWSDAIGLSMAFEAVKGNHNAAKEMGDRVEGKSPQRIEIMDHTQKRTEVVVLFDASVPSREQQRIKGELEESVKPAIDAEVVESAENEPGDPK